MKTLAERFWAKVDKRGDDECWPFRGSRKNKRGHREIQSGDGRGKIGAHRVAWELANGKDPGELHVLHRCDNPPCCNPSHLFVGTNLDNIKDMVAKGRNRKEGGKLDRNHAMAVLFLRHASTFTLKQIAAQFGISHGAVSQIVSGARWPSLRRPPIMVLSDS